MGFLINPYQYVVAGLSDTSLKAYWKFNETSGDIINQSQSASDLGSAADLQVTGATRSTAGKIGNSLNFDGINDYAVSGTSLSQYNYIHESSTGQSTIVFWMKYLSAPGDTEYIFKNSPTAGANKGFVILTGGSNIYYQADNASTSIFELNSGSSYIPDYSNWYFYVCRSDVNITSGTATVRRNDGNQVSTNRTNAPTTGNATQNLIIGANHTPTRFANFNLDETSFWSKIMSAGDETLLYNAGAGLEIY